MLRRCVWTVVFPSLSPLTGTLYILAGLRCHLERSACNCTLIQMESALDLGSVLQILNFPVKSPHIIQLFAKTLATALVEKKNCATTRNRLISVIEYIATVDPSNSY